MKKHILFTLLIVSSLLILGQRKHWTNGNGLKCKKKYATKYYTIIKEKSTNLFLKQYYLFDNNHLIEGTHYVTKKSINREGKHITYYNNEKIKETGNYKNNLKTGEWKSYFKNEKTQSITNYYNGIKNGPHIYYYENNRVVTGSYKNGLKDLLWSISDGSNKLIETSFYKENKRDGKTTYYHNNGNIKQINYYLKGKLLEVEKHDLNGLKILEEEDTSETVFLVVDEQPEFQGGMNKLMHFIARNTEYPMAALENNIHGRVYVSFIIEKDGRVSNVKSAIPGKANILLEEEAIRVVKSMPNWTPGKQRGVPVRTQFTVPINFKIR